jgi:cytochrome c-type biogenesis protein CcmH
MQFRETPNHRHPGESRGPGSPSAAPNSLDAGFRRNDESLLGLVFRLARSWIPAFAGMTLVLASLGVRAEVETAKPPIDLTPAQEAQYRALLPELRCLVCQNESLAESQASLADDLRYEVRGLVAKGESDAEVKKYLTDRYGDFVLYKPPLAARTVILWFGPFVLLVVGLFWVIRYARKSRSASPTPTKVDEAALKKILDDSP